MLKRSVIIFSIIMPFSAAIAEELSLAPVVHPVTIANFSLTETVLKKMEQVQDELLRLPSEADGTENSYDNSIAGLTATLEKKPKLMAVLVKNGMSARDYVMSYMALSAALAAAAAENEEQIFDETHAVSKENLAFGKKYANRIRKLLDG